MRNPDDRLAGETKLRLTLRKGAYYWSKILRKFRFSAISMSEVHPTSKIEAGSTFYQSSLGKHSFCGYECDIFHADIGSFVSIANAVVLGGGRHPMEWVGMSPVFYEGRDSVKAKFAIHKRRSIHRVKVGHDVWIGRSAIVLPGVTVGDGAVIGAGAIVTKDVAPYAIVAGNPARLIRYRFNQSTIERLQELKWWDMDEERLRQLGPFVTDVEKFLEIAEKA